MRRNSLPPFDPNQFEFDEDPYPVYRQYREDDPINWGLPYDPRLPGMWCLFRHEDCQELFRLGQLSPCPVGGMPSKLGWDFNDGTPPEADAYFELRRKFLTAQDPPEHTRVRRVLAPLFTAKRIQLMRPRVAQLVDAMIDDIIAAGAGPMDFIEKLAYPLPLIVVSELMGVPESDHELVHEMSAGLGAGFDLDGTFDPLLRAADAAKALRRYLDTVFNEYRANPRDNVISAMVESVADGTLTDADIYAAVSILIQGGQTTTMSLLGLGLQGLLQQRDQFERLVRDPDGLAVSGTEELLRWASPATRPPARFAYEDIEIGGVLIQRGEAIEPMLQAANRDPEEFADPDLIDLSRTPNRHLAFGGGVHRCIGSSLARLQGDVVFSSLAKRLPNLQLDETSTPTYLQRRVVRAVTSLRVVVGEPA